MKNPRRTTMEDVARAVGLSRTTVSFVLNDRPDVRIPASTRERVKRAARELGYRPHSGSRALSSQRTGRLGLVSEIVTRPFDSATIRGIRSAARQAGCSLLIAPTSAGGEEDPHAFETLLRTCVEGIVYATGRNRRVSLPPQAREIPTVLVHGTDPSLGLPEVRPDEHSLGRLGAQALLEGGHRDIGVIELPDDGGAPPGRRAGCEEGLAQAGIPWEAVRSARADGTARGGHAAASALMEESPGLTALLCGNDLMAMGAYDALRDRGLRVGEDVAVIAIDDQGLIADQLRPALTTVALPWEDMGRAGAEHLLALVAGEQVPARTLVPGRLIRRHSA
ncbi:MAG: LacI family DNA-binding transcriptional regulator [Actinomyces bowdenii]|nr:LacI family DNA-binding transcriptional regulator [Actinomyces bowdenii]